MTLEEMLVKHKALWNWIADETERRKGVVTKAEYFEKNNISAPENDCYGCEYAKQFTDGEFIRCLCEECPFDWSNAADQIESCLDDGSIYDIWVRHILRNEWQLAAEAARKIAELPLKWEETPVPDDSIKKEVRYEFTFTE